MSVTSTISSGYGRVSQAALQAKEAVSEQGYKFLDSKIGRALKRIANVPVNFVKSHPKLIATVGIATTAIGGLTANPAAVGIGIALISVGTLGYMSSRHAESKATNQQLADALQKQSEESEKINQIFSAKIAEQNESELLCSDNQSLFEASRHRPPSPLAGLETAKSDTVFY